MERANDQLKRKPSLSQIAVGPIIAFASVVSYFLVFARFPVLRDIPWLNAPVALLGCYFSFHVLRKAFKNRQPWFPLALSGIGFLFSTGISALFFVYIVFLSYQMPSGKGANGALDLLPAIQSTSQDGTPFDSADLAGKNLVIVFYRGYW